jgi:hypothetical protein
MFEKLKYFWKKRSKKPWVEIVSDGIEDGQVKLEFEWNDAFIKEIRDHGFVGHTEEECIQQWLEALTRQTTQEIEEEVVDHPSPENHPSLSSGHRLIA